jgi:hypothetical protein
MMRVAETVLVNVIFLRQISAFLRQISAADFCGRKLLMNGELHSGPSGFSVQPSVVQHRDGSAAGPAPGGLATASLALP